MLELRGVEKRFGGLQAVAGVSLAIEAGGIVGLIGRNGAGKTTVFNLVAGRYFPTAGSVLFDGRDITREPAERRALAGIARTFQIPEPLSSMDVLSNVMVGAFAHAVTRREAEALAHEVLERTGLAAKARLRASELTVPDLRRLEVARALATKPRLLLLDEAMAGLRPSEVDDAMALCRAVREAGVTLIVVEHVMYAVMNLCDRVVVMDQGRVIADGTPRDIGTNRTVIDAYLGREHAA